MEAGRCVVPPAGQRSLSGQSWPRDVRRNHGHGFWIASSFRVRLSATGIPARSLRALGQSVEVHWKLEMRRIASGMPTTSEPRAWDLEPGALAGGSCCLLSTRTRRQRKQSESRAGGEAAVTHGGGEDGEV